jgi:uncharacterized HAD superfamily protein
MRIGLDIDGVMYMWQKTACYMIREVLPNSPYKDAPLREEFWSGWDWLKTQIAPEHWEWLWTEGVRLGLFRYGHLYPGTIQAVRTLAEQGHEVVLITHRPQSAVPDTLAWLALLNLPLAGLHLLTNAEPKSRVRPMCDVYLDDKPDNIVDLCENTDAERVVLMRRPWNEVWTPDVASWPSYAYDARDWNEFIEIVEETR